MMYNNLKPGDFCMPMPIGLQLTLQYNVEGNIEKVFTGFKDRVDITHDIVGTLVSKKTIPAKINMQNCTTWVFGVLYTSTVVDKTTVLSNGITKELIQKYISGEGVFNFFAASMENSIGSLTGSIAIRRALAMNTFRILPGWDLFSQFNNKLLSLWVAEDKYTFKPIVTDIVALGRDSGIQCISTGASQAYITKVNNFVDVNGYLKTEIISDDKQAHIIPYADAVRYNINKGTVVYFNDVNEVIYSSTITTAEQAKPVKCKCCGKLIQIPTKGNVRCENIHCTSRLIPQIKTFCTTLNLPVLPDETYKEYITKQQITGIPDIFLLDEYKDIEVNTSAATLLRALIPYDLIARDDVMLVFTMGCMENIETIGYYMDHPDQIKGDLKIDHVDLPALLEWFGDAWNVSDMSTLLTIPTIQIADNNKKFDGAPIFRNKLIYLTGTFLHGSMGYVSSILQSYSAKVTTTMSNNVDCVLVGGTHENIDGKALTTARSLHISIMEELPFFTHYGIDEDIQQNNLV